tara:strand:+ start:10798 stop:11442 length:645 start_codon:yes stop_codon:yes gene_type:complete
MKTIKIIVIVLACLVFVLFVLPFITFLSIGIFGDKTPADKMKSDFIFKESRLKNILKENKDSISVKNALDSLTVLMTSVEKDSLLPEHFAAYDSFDSIIENRAAYEESKTWFRDMVARENAAAEKQAKMDAIISSVFSAWDGSCRNLERSIKNNMNDPDSYEHIETRYSYDPDEGYFDVITKFRGRNGFGGMVVNAVKAKVLFDGTVESAEFIN